jgi:hypothetical protein
VADARQGMLVAQGGDNFTDLTPHQTLEKIEYFIKHPPQGSKIFRIDPDVVAPTLLGYNQMNRNKKSEKIKLYAKDMANNDWRPTGDTMKFSDASRLRDGQNRLFACISAGKPFETAIAFGIPDNAFAKMDRGRNRSSGDVLTIAGYHDTNSLAAAVRWAYLLDERLVHTRKTIQPDETLALLQDRYENLPEYLKLSTSAYRLFLQPKGLMAAYFYAIHKSNPEKAAEWIRGWTEGTETPRLKSRGQAVKRLAEISAMSAGRVNEVVRAAVLVLAWNAFVQPRNFKKDDIYAWRIQDKFPEIL